MLPTSASTGSLKTLRRRPARKRWLRPDTLGLLLLAAAAFIALSVLYGIHASSHLPEFGGADAAAVGGSLRRSSRLLARSDRTDLHTLVIYVYSGTDQEYEENLRFFLREGVKVSARADGFRDPVSTLNFRDDCCSLQGGQRPSHESV